MDDVSNVFRHASRPDVIVFMTQVAVRFIVVVTSLINLSLYPNSETKSLWVTFLIGALGCMMPNPRFKGLDENQTKGLTAFMTPEQATLTRNG